MTKQKAQFLLGIHSKAYTEKELKKQYIKMALKYHPDKNKHGKDRFIQIQEAYQFLNKLKGWKSSSSNTNISSSTEIPSFESIFDKDTISEYMHTLFDTDKDTYSLVESFFINTYQKTNHLFDKMDKEMMNKMKRFVSRYATHLCNDKTSTNIRCDNDGNGDCESDRENKGETTDSILKHIITIHPSLTDLLQGNIRVIEYEGESYYIPVWYPALEYDKLIIEIIPRIDDNISIDDDNNVFVFVHLDASSIFEQKVFDIVIGDREYNIPIEMLYIKRNQILDITNVNEEWNGGIPYVSDSMFSISEYGNIYVNVTIE